MIPGTRFRQNLSIEARASIAPLRTLASWAAPVFAAIVAVLAGFAVAHEQLEVALLASATLAGLAIFQYLGLPTWCSVLLVTTVAARGISSAIGLPAVADFLHYPVALGFILAAVDRSPRPASRAPGRWLAGLLFVTLLSAIAHPDDPMRTALFLLITGEPLAVLWAMSRWGADRSTMRTMGIVAVLLAVIQLPIGVYQGLTYGWSDPVQGTLAGHGAGHHVLGGLFALGSFVILAAVISGRLSPIVGALGGAVCFGMMIATGSIAITIIAAIAAFAGALFAPASRVQRFRRRRFTTVVVAATLGASGVAFAVLIVPNLLERAESLAFGREPPELELVRERAESDPMTLWLGSGPGTSSSRASLLLIDPEPGSPLQALGLEPTDFGLEIYSTTTSEYGGSVEAAASSALGVIGDLGLLGFVGLIALFVALWRQAGRSSNWLAPAARSAIVMIAAIIFVDNWLEYPEFSVPLAILFGLVVSDAPDGVA